VGVACRKEMLTPKLCAYKNEQSLVHIQESDSSHFRSMILLGMKIIITKVSRGVNIKNINVMEIS
jgi:hypothetical protein